VLISQENPKEWIDGIGNEARSLYIGDYDFVISSVGYISKAIKSISYEAQHYLDRIVGGQKNEKQDSNIIHIYRSGGYFRMCRRSCFYASKEFPEKAIG
jgi:hypothetical protein